MAKIKKGRLLVTVIILIILIYSYFLSKHGYFALKRMEQKADSLMMLQDSLAKKLEEINKKTELLEKHDPETIEKEARDLGLAKEGEELLIIKVDSSTVEK